MTSVLPEDFPTNVAATGVLSLRAYLDFARRGIEALAVEVGAGGSDTESPFEEDVLRYIQSLGHLATPQVGVAGYRIDLGVRDPADPSRYVLGVECDGAMYHSTRVARDRDRLREEVIRGLGWRLHRIWSASWFYNQEEQRQRLVKAIEQAIQRSPEKPTPRVPESEVQVEQVDFSAPPDWAIPYEEAVPTPPRIFFEMHDPAARADLRRMIKEVLAIEAPVHEERVLRLVREAWGVGRAGHRIKTAFDSAAGDLEVRRDLLRDANGFWWRGDQDTFDVRAPAEDAESIRPVAHVPPEELAEAAYRLVRDAGAIEKDNLQVAVARLFGWGRTGIDITTAIEIAIDDLVDEGRLSGGAFLTAPGDE